MDEFKLLRLGAENGLAFLPYIPEGLRPGLLNKDRMSLGLETEGKACAALVSTVGKAEIVLESLFVDPEARGRGGGTKLLSALKAFAKRFGKENITAEYFLPAMRRFDLFLWKQGFLDRTAEETRVYRVPFEAALGCAYFQKERPALKGKIVSWDELPADFKASVRAETGRDVPKFVSPEEADGTVLGGASFAYVEEGRLAGFVICTLMKRGGLYLNSIYARNGGARALPQLIYRAVLAMRREYPDQDAFYVTVTDRNGRHILEQIAGEDLDELEQQTLYRVTLPLAAERGMGMENHTDMILQPEFSILMPKLSWLEPYLEEAGFDHDIIARKEELPYIRCVRREGGREEINLRYYPLDEDAEDFLLTISSEVSAQVRDMMGLGLICESFNQKSAGPVACPDLAEGKIYLRSGIPESGLPISGETLKLALRLFLNGMEELEQLPDR